MLFRSSKKNFRGRAALKMYALIFIFFTIIPIVYCGRKKWILWSEKSIINKEVTFNAVNGELYVDNKKMNVAYNETKTEIYVDDFMIYEGKYGVKTTSASFIGFIEEPYLQDFIKFLDEQSIRLPQ